MILSYQSMKKDLFGNKEKDQNLEKTIGPLACLHNRGELGIYDAGHYERKILSCSSHEAQVALRS